MIWTAENCKFFRVNKCMKQWLQLFVMRVLIGVLKTRTVEVQAGIYQNSTFEQIRKLILDANRDAATSPRENYYNSIVIICTPPRTRLLWYKLCCLSSFCGAFPVYMDLGIPGSLFPLVFLHCCLESTRPENTQEFRINSIKWFIPQRFLAVTSLPWQFYRRMNGCLRIVQKWVRHHSQAQSLSAWSIWMHSRWTRAWFRAPNRAVFSVPADGFSNDRRCPLQSGRLWHVACNRILFALDSLVPSDFLCPHKFYSNVWPRACPWAYRP